MSGADNLKNPRTNVPKASACMCRFLNPKIIRDLSFIKTQIDGRAPCGIEPICWNVVKKLLYQYAFIGTHNSYHSRSRPDQAENFRATSVAHANGL